MLGRIVFSLLFYLAGVLILPALDSPAVDKNTFVTAAEDSFEEIKRLGKFIKSLPGFDDTDQLVAAGILPYSTRFLLNPDWNVETPLPIGFWRIQRPLFLLFQAFLFYD